jgi:hypothetical protein
MKPNSVLIMASKLLKKNELKFEDFEPVSEMQELPEKYILTVNLPGKHLFLIACLSSMVMYVCFFTIRSTNFV